MIVAGPNASQLLRRLTQFSVLFFVVVTAFGGPWRNYKLAHGQQRLVELMQGPVWGFLYGAYEDALGLLGDSFEVSLSLLGFPWSGRIFGLETADPLLVASLGIQGTMPPLLLLVGLAIPLGLALVLGKVFCSHLCPARLLFELGERVRSGLLRLRIPLPEWRPAERLGGWVLAGGLLASAFSSAAVWLLLLPYASLGAGIHLYVAGGAATVLLGIVGFWLTVDALLAPGLFCKSLCPTGFLLEQAGRFSWLRVAKRSDATPCPSGCNVCQQSCPYALLPRDGSHVPACDSCGRCVSSCPGGRLQRQLLVPLVGVLALVCLPLPADAHHNKGMPHYGYFENYAQVPSEEYVTLQGRWEMGATLFNFQGLDRRNSDTPNDVKIYIYLYDLEANAGWEGQASFTVEQDGEVIARFDREQVDEESVYSTRETMPRSGDYELVARVDGERVVLPFHVELAGGGVSWGLVLGLTLPVAVVFGLALHGRSRHKRPRARARQRGRSAITGALLAGAFLLSPIDANAQHAAHAPIPAESGHHEHAAEHAGAPPMTHADHEDASGSADPMVMVMGGIPLPFVLVGVAAILLLSFVATERWAPVAPRRRPRNRNLIRNPRIYAVLRSRWSQAVPQFAMVGVLVFLIGAGLLGSPSAGFVPTAVWTIWWGGLIFAVLFLGSAWCFVCPWDGLANLASRLRLAARVEPLSMGLPFPRFLANLYPAIALFALLTWLELAKGVTTDPRFTAYMGIGMAAAAVGSALLWDGKRFCAHLCPVGRICGVYSNVSPIEIRARNPKTCEVCTTEECLHGNERGYPCPTGISLKTTTDATMCTACTECIKSCDKHNVALNLRPIGADVMAPQAPRLDVAWLAVVLLALTLFHGLSMTGLWENFEPGRLSILKWMSQTFGTSRLTSFSLAMTAAVAIPVTLYAGSCALGARWAAGGVSSRELFSRQALSLLPIALFYHLAHNLMHLGREAGHIVPELSDPLGVGADWLGTQAVAVGPLLSNTTLWFSQLGLIVFGHVLGVVVAHRIGHSIFPEASSARRALVPLLVVMVLVSIGGLWLTHLDMNMRMGRM